MSRTPQQEAISQGMRFAWKRRKREAREKPEQDLHMAVAAFLRVALKPPTIWTTFPAGGGGRVRGAFLKAMGLQAGWPDILVIDAASAAYHRSLVVGIELKAAKGRLSNAQEDVRSSFVAAGAHWFLARSVDEVEGFLRGVGIPLHATTQGGQAEALREPPASHKSPLDFVRIKRVG